MDLGYGNNKLSWLLRVKMLQHFPIALMVHTFHSSVRFPGSVFNEAPQSTTIGEYLELYARMCKNN